MKISFLFLNLFLFSCNQATLPTSTAGNEINPSSNRDIAYEVYEESWIGELRWCRPTGDGDACDKADLIFHIHSPEATLDFNVQGQDWGVLTSELIPRGNNEYSWGGGKIKFIRNGSQMNFCYTDQFYGFIYECTVLNRY